MGSQSCASAEVLTKHVLNYEAGCKFLGAVKTFLAFPRRPAFGDVIQAGTGRLVDASSMRQRHDLNTVCSAFTVKLLLAEFWWWWMNLESEIIRPGEKGSRQDKQGIKGKLLKEDRETVKCLVLTWLNLKWRQHVETKTWAYEAKEWDPSLKRRGNSGHLNKSVTVMWLTDRFSAGSRPSRAVTQVEETTRNRALSKKTLTFKESSRERKGLQQGEDLISDRSRTVTNDYFHYLIV